MSWWPDLSLKCIEPHLGSSVVIMSSCIPQWLNVSDWCSLSWCHWVFIGIFHIDSCKPCFSCSKDPVEYKNYGLHFSPNFTFFLFFFSPSFFYMGISIHISVYLCRNNFSKSVKPIFCMMCPRRPHKKKSPIGGATAMIQKAVIQKMSVISFWKKSWENKM